MKSMINTYLILQFFLISDNINNIKHIISNFIEKLLFLREIYLLIYFLSLNISFLLFSLI